jgi:D-alanyl-D-alanine carboxypeptidase
LLATPPAHARADRHHHAYLQHRATPQEDVAPPSAGFGPTSAGASTILIDAASGHVLQEYGADVPRYPASLTKLMTLDLAFQALRDGRMTLDTQIPVSYHAAAVEPVKLGLQPGDEISVHQAILAMTTMSANDAATALGEYLGGGSEARCAQMMTLRAHALGMAQTSFYNASGLPNPNQITTARDLAILARDIVVNYPEDQPFFEVQAFDFNGRMVLSNNQMLKLYPGATGMKTGYTVLARHNLVTSAQRGGRVLIGVTLHEPSWAASYEDMTAMLNSGFGLRVTWPDAAIAAAPAPARPRAALAAGWTAQFGVYTRMSRARRMALEARRLRGAGIARVARVQVHGRQLWTAQLAGLSLTAAHETCAAISARGDACRVVPPAEHLALENSSPASI